MFERERTLYSFVLHYAELLSADIDDARMADQPSPGVNHPAWVLGHLAICTDYAARLLGLPMACPKDWHRDFGPGSTPRTDRSSYPPKADLLAALTKGHERVAGAVGGVTAERLAERHSVELAFLKEWLPTVGDLLTHLMTTHPATHLGQLSAWRRQMGMGGVLAL